MNSVILEPMEELSFESVQTLNQEQFWTWIQRRPVLDVNHYELLNGRVVVNPPAGYPHGESDAKVGRILGVHVNDRNLGKVFASSQGFELPSGDTVEPDASFVSKAQWKPIPKEDWGKFIRIVPDLVVEVLSPSNKSRDRGEKKAIYERNGVKEYWLLDPIARHLTIFHLEDGRYSSGFQFFEDDTVASRVLPDLSFQLLTLLPEP